MATKSNTLEGGSDETTITTGNSGGGSGDAFNNVFIGSTHAIVFDTARAAHGSLSARVTLGATGGSAHFDWTGLGSISEVFVRAYVYIESLDTLPSRIVLFQTSAFSLCGRVAVEDVTGPKIRLYNSGNTLVATGGTNVTQDAWIRIEVRLLANTTTGILEAKLFNTVESPTPSETITASSINTNTAVDKILWAFEAGSLASRDLWLDSLGYDTTAYMGPIGGGGGGGAAGRRALLGVGI